MMSPILLACSHLDIPGALTRSAPSGCTGCMYHPTRVPATLLQLGLDYAFWSAFRVSEELQALRMEAQDHGEDVHELRAARRRERKEAEARQRRGGEGGEEDPRIRLLDGEDLIELIEERARAAVEVRNPGGARGRGRQSR